MALSQMAGRQLPLFSLIVPAWLVATMSGWRGVLGCWPAIIVCGGSFAGLQFLMANFHGPALVDVVGGLGSLVALAVSSAILATARGLAICRRTASGRTSIRAELDRRDN